MLFLARDSFVVKKKTNKQVSIQIKSTWERGLTTSQKKNLTSLSWEVPKSGCLLGLQQQNFIKDTPCACWVLFFSGFLQSASFYVITTSSVFQCSDSVLLRLI